MQSSLAARRIISFFAQSQKQVSLWARSSSSIGRTADPATHAGETGVEAEEEQQSILSKEGQEKLRGGSGVVNNQQPLKPTTIGSSPKIQTSEVNNPIDPNKQQKRHYQVSSREGALEDVSCVGLDGFPEAVDGDRKRQEEDDREYFKHRKASPLSEIELGETRKPISQATDGKGVGGDGGVIVWTEEQLESAEETMMKTMRMWRERAARGDPDSPQSRALRAALSARGEHAV